MGRRLLKDDGFTLIELIMVIVILGILAAAAVPKFMDLSTDAKQAAIKGAAAAVGSGCAQNYAKRTITPGSTATLAVTTSAGCAAAATDASATSSKLVEGGLPTDYTWAGSGTAPNCTLKGTDSAGTAYSASFICSVIN